jgi:hypothetical protein
MLKSQCSMIRFVINILASCSIMLEISVAMSFMQHDGVRYGRFVKNGYNWSKTKYQMYDYRSEMEASCFTGKIYDIYVILNHARCFID